VGSENGHVVQRKPVSGEGGKGAVGGEREGRGGRGCGLGKCRKKAKDLGERRPKRLGKGNGEYVAKPLGPNRDEIFGGGEAEKKRWIGETKIQGQIGGDDMEVADRDHKKLPPPQWDQVGGNESA